MPMMADFGWLIWVVAIVIWVVTAAVRSMNEANKPRPKLPDRTDRPALGPTVDRPREDRPRPAGSSIERFQQELERLRQQRGEAPRPVAPPPPPVAREEPKRPREAPRPRPVVREEPQPRPRSRPEPEVVEAELVAEPVSPGPTPAFAVAMPARIAADARLTRQAAPPAVVAMLALLRGRENIRAAVLLQEVLGPPKCRQR